MNELNISFQMGNNEEANFTAKNLRHVKKSDDAEEIVEIPWDKIIELEHEENDDDVTINYTDEENDKAYLIISCANNAEAERLMDEAHKILSIGYSDDISKMSMWEAASTQLLFALGTAVIGGIFTAIMYAFYNYTPQRTHVVKIWVKLLYELAQKIGYMPSLVITVLVFAACLLWAFQRISKPLQHRVIKKTISE